jgi:hypothetical protein
MGKIPILVPCKLGHFAEIKRLPVILNPGYFPVSEVSILVTVHMFIQNQTLHNTMTETTGKE